ncbi:MAG: 16S rRNA (cytosine(1402)-N(4))-methyltransferase RsmH [Tepidisphaeraceae bacterium]
MTTPSDDSQESSRNVRPPDGAQPMGAGDLIGEMGHDPVLHDQVLNALFPAGASPQTILDCTLGRGGHALAIANRLAEGSVLIALDRDHRNLQFAAKRLAAVSGKVRFFHANFSDFPDVLKEIAVDRVDGILADLGVSTNQLFDPQYGLSFQQDSPLDMRLNADDPFTAADLVNTWPEEQIANTLYELADERYSRRIARKIGEVRAISPIQTTGRLAELVRQVVPRIKPRRHNAPRSSAESIDPATRTFLALRMAVNREVDNLRQLLDQAPRYLAPGGRLAVISFQSTEDRIVKHALRRLSEEGQLEVLTKKPIEPTEDEIARNPRSRSSKMRVAQRTA